MTSSRSGNSSDSPQSSNEGWVPVSCGCFRKPPHCLLTFFPSGFLFHSLEVFHIFLIPSSHHRIHSSIITLIIFIMPTAFQGIFVAHPKLKETLYFHDYSLQKRPKGRRELQSSSLPRFAKCLSILALCNISCSVFAGYFLPQDMYPKASLPGQDVDSQI